MPNWELAELVTHLRAEEDAWFRRLERVITDALVAAAAARAVDGLV